MEYLDKDNKDKCPPPYSLKAFEQDIVFGRLNNTI